MAEALDISAFLAKAAEGIPVVDVRSPSEYAHAHFPGAFSIPIFNDAQRAAVGTVYTHQGKVDAVKKGLEFVGPELKNFANLALRLKSPELLVYCWRGGMRSASMSWLFETLDLKCFTLRGGYKAYRNHVLEAFGRKWNLAVIGGCTGSGKTDMLRELESRGEQVLDLEGLACHKGSAFGSLGEQPQPSTEMFEHKIFEVLCRFDPDRVIWVEDESRNVGKDLIPEGLWRQMESAPLVIVDTDYTCRLERIMQVYAAFSPETVAPFIMKIEKRIGREKCRAAYDACLSGDMREAARICLAYYDRLYLSQLEDRKRESCRYVGLKCGSMDVTAVCDEVMALKENFI